MARGRSESSGSPLCTQEGHARRPVVPVHKRRTLLARRNSAASQVPPEGVDRKHKPCCPLGVGPPPTLGRDALLERDVSKGLRDRTVSPDPAEGPQAGPLTNDQAAAEADQT